MSMERYFTAHELVITSSRVEWNAAWTPDHEFKSWMERSMNSWSRADELELDSCNSSSSASWLKMAAV